MPLWEGRFGKELNEEVNDFNKSIEIDSVMYKEDILGSIAHSKMLCKQGIIEKEDFEKIEKGLLEILSDIESGTLKIDMSEEDIHTFIETTLTEKIGNTGKKLHTARSRNDQVALDTRMYLKKEIISIKEYLTNFIDVLLEKAENNLDTIIPGYTHMQRAQPITFAHYLMAYVEMFLRDIKRLDFTFEETNILPLGSCALAATTHNIDRLFVKDELGFSDITYNSIDGVSDRDYLLDLSENIAMIMMHLSRFSEEIILYSSWEFKFIELDDAFSTGSSIMPQKKNPDITELVRGKCGRAYGNMNSLFVMMKALPLAYNKDLQEDKELIFDSIKTVKNCLKVIAPMCKTMTINKENMLNAAKKGFINATDLADYLAKNGVPFRTAYKEVGLIVKYAIENNKTLDEIDLETYKKFDSTFKEDLYDEIDLKKCIQKRTIIGGPAPEIVEKRISQVKKLIKK